MRISLPYFRHRRYLTGIDWLLGAMSYATAKTYSIGGFSQAILDIEGFLPEDLLKSALSQISNQFPLIHAKTSRDWFNLAPYWKVSRKSRSSKLKLRVVDLPEEESHRADQLFDEHVNQPFETKFQHLRFLLIRIGKSRSRLGMMFDHRLFDAFAAETFFKLIDQTWQGRLAEVAPQIKQTEPPHLDNWQRRFQSGKTVNRLLAKLNEQEVTGLKMPPPGNRPIRFLHEKLSPEESSAFNKNAAAEIGMPVILPSATARAVLAMQQEFPQSQPNSQYLIFTSANMRSAGQEWQTLLSNQFSLMPLSASATPLPQTIPQTALALRDQLFERMKENVPFVMQDAAMLGRIFPHWLGQKFLKFVGKGKMCSFYFACLRESGFAEEKFMGLPTVNLIHTPLVFSPPGLNICMTSFRGSFNLVISYLEGAISDAAAKRMMQTFKASLQGPDVAPRQTPAQTPRQ